MPVQLTPIQDSFCSSFRPTGVASEVLRFRLQYDHNFLSLVASFFSRRCLPASSSCFLHAVVSLCPPSMTVLTHTSASNAVAFQSLAMLNARTSLSTQLVHYFSFPPRPHRTAPSRFPKPIRFGNRPPLIRTSAPAHKSLLMRNVVSMLSHRVISRAWLYAVIRWSGLLR